MQLKTEIINKTRKNVQEKLTVATYNIHYIRYREAIKIAFVIFFHLFAYLICSMHRFMYASIHGFMRSNGKDR